MTVEKKGRNLAMTVAGIEFRSKRAVVDYVQAILSRYRPEDLLNEEDFRFVRDLFEKNPYSKKVVGCGICSIQVYQPDVFWRGESAYKAFRAIRVDGTMAQCGFRHAIFPPNKRKHFIQACRTVVYKQVTNFTARAFGTLSARVWCPCEKLWIQYGEHAVDYSPTSFEELVDTYIATKEINTYVVKFEKGNLCFSDDNLANDWAEYHAKHAQMRIISRAGSLMKGLAKS